MTDPTKAYILENKIPLTQRGGLELNYMGDKHTGEDLQGEGWGDLGHASRCKK